MDLKEKIRSIPDFPIPGVLFRDITTLLKDGEGYRALIDELAASLGDEKVDLVIGPEARGFVIGSALASMSMGWSTVQMCWKSMRTPFGRASAS